MKKIPHLLALILLLNNSCQQQSKLTDENSGMNKPLFSITPPLEGENVAKENFQIDNTKDTVLVSEHGSFILVPANCFQDQNGQEVSDQVSVSFTEYANVSDIFLSGIPMNYIEGKDTHTFQSAGMCKIEAFDQEKPLQIKEDASLSIGLRNKAQDTDYNLYYFDTLKGEWLERAKDLAVQTSDNLPMRPVADINADTNRIVHVSIDDFANRPGIGTWHQTKFYLVEGESPEFANQGIWWYDMRLAETANEDLFEMNFYGVKEGKQYQENLLVQPLIDSSDFENERNIFRKKVRNYAREILAIQQEAEARRLKDSTDAAERHREDSLYQARTEHQRQKTMEVYRTFQVKQLGIFNCDRFYLPQESLATRRIIFMHESKELNFGSTFLLSPEDNAVLNYIQYTNGGYQIQLGNKPYFFAGVKNGILYTAKLNIEDLPHQSCELQALITETAELEKMIAQ
jgi:hypothetical protein